MSRKALVTALLAVLGVALISTLALRLVGGRPPAGRIEASGRIEGRITQVTPKVGGTVADTWTVVE